MDGSKPICYWRGQAADFLDPNPELKWVPLVNDEAIGKVDEPHRAGLVSIRLSIHDKTKDGPIDFLKQPVYKEKLPKRLSTRKVRAYIYQCRDLPSADSDGQSDPYIEAWNPEGERAITRVIDDNLNPIFYQTLEVNMYTSTMKSAPPLVLNIYDSDEGMFDSTDDFIGRAIIDINKVPYAEDDTILPPTWHPVVMGFGDGAAHQGEILASFAVVESDYDFAATLNYVNLQ
jgi:hypothetical protein